MQILVFAAFLRCRCQRTLCYYYAGVPISYRYSGAKPISWLLESTERLFPTTCGKLHIFLILVV